MKCNQKIEFDGTEVIPCVGSMPVPVSCTTLETKRRKRAPFIACCGEEPDQGRNVQRMKRKDAANTDFRVAARLINEYYIVVND